MCTNFFFYFIPLLLFLCFEFFVSVWSGLFRSSPKNYTKFKWEWCFIDFSRAALQTLLMWMGCLCCINRIAKSTRPLFSQSPWISFHQRNFSFWFFFVILVSWYPVSIIEKNCWNFELILLGCLVWPARKKERNDEMLSVQCVFVSYRSVLNCKRFTYKSLCVRYWIRCDQIEQCLRHDAAPVQQRRPLPHRTTPFTDNLRLRLLRERIEFNRRILHE